MSEKRIKRVSEFHKSLKSTVLSDLGIQGTRGRPQDDPPLTRRLGGWQHLPSGWGDWEGRVWEEGGIVLAVTVPVAPRGTDVSASRFLRWS